MNGNWQGHEDDEGYGQQPIHYPPGDYYDGQSGDSRAHVRWSSGRKAPGDESDEADDDSARRRRARGRNQGDDADRPLDDGFEQPYRKPFPSEVPRDFDHLYPPPLGNQHHPSHSPSPFNTSRATPSPMPDPSRASAAYTPRGPYPPSAPSTRTSSPAPEPTREPAKKSNLKPSNPSTSGSTLRSALDKLKLDGSPRQAKNAHVAASVAGAVAGGLIGHQASKGDVVATLAGAMLGLLGAGVAEEEVAKRKSRERSKGKGKGRSQL